MARSFAQVKVTIWDDPDFLALDHDAQRLYFVLMTRVDLSMAGVIGWHPGRISQLAHDTTVEAIEAAAAKLERARFVVIDRTTDECLLRTFVKHDDALCRGPRTAAGVVSAWRSVYSQALRTVIAHSVGDEQGLSDSVLAVVEPLLDWASVTPLEEASFAPSDTPSDTPSRQPATSNQQPATSNPAQKRGSRIPDDFTVTDSMREWAAKEAPHADVDRATANFVNHWTSKTGKDATKLDWLRTWQNWMRTDSDRTPEWKRRKAANGEPRIVTTKSGHEMEVFW